MEEYTDIIRLIYGNANEEALQFGIKFSEVVLAIIGSIIGIIVIISMWKIFKKAGQKPWKCFIPIYNMIIFYKISGMSPIFLLSFILLLIPQTNFIGFIIWNIVDATQKSLLARKFDKSVGFIIGLILFDFIFYPILAFDKSEYKKANAE